MQMDLETALRFAEIARESEKVGGRIGSLGKALTLVDDERKRLEKELAMLQASTRG